MKWFCLLFFFLGCPVSAQQIACSPQANDIVLVIAGQSNGGSYGDVAYVPPNTGGVQFSNGNCYVLKDPLVGLVTPGTPGSGGSIWSRLWQDMTLPGHLPMRRLVVVDIVDYGTPSSNWAATGPDFHRLTQAKTELAAAGWPISAIFFIDGETDAVNGIGTASYIANIQSMISGSRAAGITAPFFIAIATHCNILNGINPVMPGGKDLELLNYGTRNWRQNQRTAIQLAQISVVDHVAGIYLGANMDLLGSGRRWDNLDCHLGDQGQWDAAVLWENIVMDAVASEVIP